MVSKNPCKSRVFKKKLDTSFDTLGIKIGVQLWCERWDSNPHGITTRTSNVLVYHSNTLASAPKYYNLEGQFCQHIFPILCKFLVIKFLTFNAFTNIPFINTMKPIKDFCFGKLITKTICILICQIIIVFIFVFISTIL